MGAGVLFFTWSTTRRLSEAPSHDGKSRTRTSGGGGAAARAAAVVRNRSPRSARHASTSRNRRQFGGWIGRVCRVGRMARIGEVLVRLRGGQGTLQSSGPFFPD